MTTPEQLQAILERIANHEQTAADLEMLRHYLGGGGQLVSHVGKYGVNLGQGQNIHVGDRTYTGADAETIREICRTLLEELQRPTTIANPQLAAVDELVRQVRSRLHDDIQRLHGTMPLWGVDHWVPLGELFVDVNILEELSSSRRSELDDLWQDFSNNPSHRSLDRMGLGEARQRVSGLEVLAKHTNLMVVGKPGSGKTTYLQRVVTECNAGNLQAHRIPVLLKLREFVDDGRSLSYSLERYLEQCWQLSAAETQRVLNQGRSLVLLDGLDEVTGEDGKTITKQIKRFARDYPQVQMVITCRTQSQESRFERFDYVEVADFNESQVRSFAEHWFQTVCADVTVGQAKATAFLEQLFREENKPIRELAITPILLSLTCAVFYRTEKFYSKRSKLYEEGLELLLERWDKSREIERDEIYRDLSVERKLELLSYLAVKKFEQEQYVLFEQAEIEGYIAEFLGIGQRESRGVLRAIEAQHGLLIERAQKVWSFSHLTFHEYLVAKWFCDRRNFQDLAKNIKIYQWREIFMLSTEMIANADSLFQLMKHQSDLLLKDDNKLQQFIIRINQRSRLVEVPYQDSAVRAFYLEFELDQAYASIGLHIVRYLILIPSLAPFLTNYILNPEQYIKEFFSFDFTLNLELGYLPRLLFDTKLEKDLQRLKSLLSAIPINNHDLLLNYSDWVKLLKETIIKHDKKHSFVYNWQFNEQQRESLRLYHQANSLLVHCLVSNCIVSTNVKQEIEETLLLPIVEIEKRKREKSE